LEQPKIVPQAALSLDPDHGIYRDNFLRPTSYLNQNVSLARRRVIHVRRVAALRDLISVP
jgi:hypothetical protein